MSEKEKWSFGTSFCCALVFFTAIVLLVLVLWGIRLYNPADPEEGTPPVWATLQVYFIFSMSVIALMLVMCLITFISTLPRKKEKELTKLLSRANDKLDSVKQLSALAASSSKSFNDLMTASMTDDP